ncbi:MAG: phosphoribosyltransferase family protein [Rhodothermales bacterium]
MRAGALHPFHIAAGRALVDLLLPVFCVACGRAARTGALPLCAGCARSMPRADLEAVREQLALLPERAGRPDTAFAMWSFVQDGPLQHLQHALKYGNRPVYGRALGGLMGPSLRDHLASASLDGVVPIPLHRARLIERGYNQSHYLAQGIADALGLPPPMRDLRRARATRTQTRLGLTARWENVADAFVAGNGVAGRRVLVVDDVLTTGATACAAALALREAGAEAVHLATLAYAARG